MNPAKHLLPLTFSALGALCGLSQGLAAPILGSADPYAVLGATLVSASGDSANIMGSVGSPTSVTGPMVITGGTPNNAGASAALSAANAAANFLGGLAGTQDLTGTDLGGPGGFGGGYTASQDLNGHTSFTRVDSGEVTPVSGEGVPPPGGPVSVVPEPATLALLGIAFAGLGLGRHRRTRFRHEHVR